jgi:hypothetical protein
MGVEMGSGVMGVEMGSGVMGVEMEAEAEAG